MHREYGHAYILPGCEHPKQEAALLIPETVQYLFFQ